MRAHHPPARAGAHVRAEAPVRWIAEQQDRRRSSRDERTPSRSTKLAFFRLAGSC
ncbi:Hypothetical protein A7982_09088 [Minicystis rosea]|nr:Hypothetical protein A7982_09088 [Minicystis rosea]